MQINIQEIVSNPNRLWKKEGLSINKDISLKIIKAIDSNDKYHLYNYMFDSTKVYLKVKYRYYTDIVIIW